MPQLSENAYTFESAALDRDAFTVIRFAGERGPVHSLPFQNFSMRPLFRPSERSGDTVNELPCRAIADIEKGGFSFELYSPWFSHRRKPESSFFSVG